MARPPRNLDKDRLMSKGMLVYIELYAGLLNAISAFVSYILVFNYHGLSLADIFNTASNCWTANPDDFVVRGRVYDADEQALILAQAQAGVYFTTVAGQFFHVWSVRVRYESIFQRNPFRNMYLNFGVLVEVRPSS
jgi:hypothetical protein